MLAYSNMKDVYISNESYVIIIIYIFTMPQLIHHKIYIPISGYVCIIICLLSGASVFRAVFITTN